MRDSILATVLSSLLLVCSGASADPPAAIRQDQTTTNAEARFQSFCASWMKKLRTREQENLSKAQVERRGDQFVIEYTGYGKDPLRCESKTTGVPQNPYIGKLVYQELRYQKTADSRKKLRKSRPRVLSQVDVLEIFRFDGSRWIY
jgi:hypothetical protein